MVPHGVPLFISDTKTADNGETAIVWKSADEINPVEYTTEEFFEPIMDHYMTQCRQLHRYDLASADGGEAEPLLRSKEAEIIPKASYLCVLFQFDTLSHFVI
jgi:hypothetical protein